MMDTPMHDRLWHALAAAAAVILVTGWSGAASLRAEPIEVRASALVLNPEDRAQDRVGRLVYLGGLKLWSEDKRFGGLSGLAFEPGGERLVAVSDLGHWFSARLVSGPDGAPRALAEAELAPLLGADGRPVAGSWRDAEAVEREADGSYVVSFERAHRIWRYDIGRGLAAALPAPVTSPPGLGRAPNNGGIEALAVLGPGRLLAVAEELAAGERELAGWLIEGEASAPLAYATSNLFRPTDFAVLPDGDLLALERRFTALAGAGARVLRIAREQIRPGARLEGEELARLAPPLSVDNMEGLAVREDGRGGLLVYLLSDDNFNPPLQATILMVFRLEE